MNESRILDVAGATALEDWLRRLEVLHPKKIDLSLDRIKDVLAALGLEGPAYRIVSIAGTNGKGSCVAMLERIYTDAGYRTGAYSSPHLWRFNERIRFGGAEATDVEIVDAFAAIDAARGRTTLSYFEFATVAALLHFARCDAELAILEVGLGGRLDAVNAVDADLALVTSIDLDHEHWLGDTREAIGLEKAGIMRAGRVAVLADRDPPQTLLDYAHALGARLRRSGVEFDYRRHDDGSWDFHGTRGSLECLPRPALPGDVQYANAAACLAAVEAMSGTLPVDALVLPRAIAAVRLPGRLQRVGLGGIEWLFDVAHNPAAARVLAEALAERPPAGRTHAIVGLMADKNFAGVLGPLAASVDAWLVTRADSERASEPQALAMALEQLGITSVRTFDDVASAYAALAREARPGDRVVTFGSFQIVGPVMAMLELYSRPSSGENAAKWTGA